jgi:hypothetical protein
MKTRYAGAQVLADRQTDMAKLVVAFRNFATRQIVTKSQCNDSSDLKTGVESVSRIAVYVPMMRLRQCKSDIHTMKYLEGKLAASN